ncbi:MAG: hypothetical protein ACFFCP_15035 [Promethearchaeota archaeon]
MHKLLPPKDEEKEVIPSPVNLLYRAKTYKIPVFAIVPKEFHEAETEILDEAAEFAKIVSPEDLDEKIRNKIGF